MVHHVYGMVVGLIMGRRRKKNGCVENLVDGTCDLVGGLVGGAIALVGAFVPYGEEGDNYVEHRFDRVFLAKKAVQDYVFTDGTADKSIERKFAEDLDAADEVCVYAKLPRAFQTPTPVGNYSPDWAIAFYEGTVKHIFFVAETKGSMESLELRPIEQAKIACAKKLFRGIATNKVVYHEVDSYQNLLAIMKSV